ncbi:AAA family ATPase, partial [Acinetobacter pittii]|uniref:AAA family ATPase n=1 Tax=Acinetobacter pittii TaxID=48296 RepID=UPI00157FBFA5
KQKKLEPFLKKIIFSNYKNFQPNTEIEFNYPLTVLVGRNGTNKSSVLKALHACIHGTSLADFWFETDLDPIHAASYWYTYDYVLPNSDKVEAQVYLTKRKREGNIDYWETSAPSTAIGMQPYPDTKDPKFSSLPNKTRWMKINPDQKSSTYLSFRESLSCFDQFYYYGTYKWIFTK